MNIFELAKQAKQAGLRTYQEQAPGIDGVVGNWADLETFATLIEAAARADEREACAKVCDELPAPDIYSNTDKSMWDVTCIDCATAIRARGTT